MERKCDILFQHHVEEGFLEKRALQHVARELSVMPFMNEMSLPLCCALDVTLGDFACNGFSSSQLTLRVIHYHLRGKYSPSNPNKNSVKH